MKRRYTAAAAMMMVMGLCASASAAATVDKTLDNYTLDGVIVEADAVRNQFGDINTEQSYYRTGGDVNVITSQTLEKRHYQQLGDALKTFPVYRYNLLAAIEAANMVIPKPILL